MLFQNLCVILIFILNNYLNNWLPHWDYNGKIGKENKENILILNWIRLERDKLTIQISIDFAF